MGLEVGAGMSEKKRRHTKHLIGECWKLQGQWEEAVKYRDQKKYEAMGQKYDTASAVLYGWEEAQKKFPILDSTLKEYYRLRTLGPKLKAEREQQIVQERNAKRSDKVEARTGIPLCDWVYANLEGEISDEPAKGDLLFLAECRKNPEEFYKKYYLPALMKRQGVSESGEAANPIQEASERSADGLLKTIREAAKS